MGTQGGGTQETMTYDVSIVRPQMREEDFKMRGQEMSPERLKKIKKGLLDLHTLETMAANIYKFQITSEPGELNRRLIIAMCNEMSHTSDFQVKLYEYGWKPCKLRWAYWLVGFALGFISRMMGKKAILSTGAWVETLAVHHYDKLLREVDWDDETRKVVEKAQADEKGHIENWNAKYES